MAARRAVEQKPAKSSTISASWRRLPFWEAQLISARAHCIFLWGDRRNASRANADVAHLSEHYSLVLVPRESLGESFGTKAFAGAFFSGRVAQGVRFFLTRLSAIR